MDRLPVLDVQQTCRLRGEVAAISREGAVATAEVRVKLAPGGRGQGRGPGVAGQRQQEVGGESEQKDGQEAADSEVGRAGRWSASSKALLTSVTAAAAM